MQSYNDENNLPKTSYRMPALVGLVLVAGKKEEALSPAMQKKFCSGTGKAMHAMQYSKLETYSAVKDLSLHMHEATWDHSKAMICIFKYSLDTVEQGLVLKPNRKWDSSQSHKFAISGRSTRTMPRNLKTDAVCHDTWCILKGHQQCLRVVQKGQRHCPLLRQSHLQVLLVSKTCSI